MCNVETYTELQRYSYDPTRTTTLRNAFVRAMRKRFTDLMLVIREAIMQQDVFGLSVANYAELQTPGYRAFDFPRLPEKVASFMEWLRRQEEAGLLETRQYYRIGSALSEAWTNIYIYDSYKRGVARARHELRKAGYKVPTIDETGGIDAVLSTPFHVDTLGVAYTRAFESLRGITSHMDMVISQVLAQALADGDDATKVTRKLIASIDGAGVGELGLRISYPNPRTGEEITYWMPARRRAEILARTEIIRAHHMANIQEYKNWQAMGVRVIAEWSTAGDERVCSVCAGLHGSRYKLEEIEHMIPVHPQCRCIAVPIEVDETGREIEY